MSPQNRPREPQDGSNMALRGYTEGTRKLLKNLWFFNDFGGLGRLKTASERLQDRSQEGFARGSGKEHLQDTSLEPFWAPRKPQGDPKTAQEGPILVPWEAQNGPQTGPAGSGRPKTGPGRPKTGLERPWEAQNGPLGGPRRALGGPRRAPDRPSEAQNGPTTAQPLQRWAGGMRGAGK